MTERATRWYAARAFGSVPVERLRGQPPAGFANVSGVMGWLEERGLIVERRDPEGDRFYERWGDPYCAVDAGRNDPWEPETSALDVSKPAEVLPGVLKWREHDRERREAAVWAAAARMKAWASEHGEADTNGLQPDEWVALARAALGVDGGVG